MRKFILGVGTQKAGTSWLYKQLSKQDSFAPPLAKEFHVLDAIYLSEMLPVRKQLFQHVANFLEKNPKSLKHNLHVKRFHMLMDNSQYFKYFDKLIDTDTGFSCDMSPSYCALPPLALKDVKVGFKSLGIKTRVVFLMREPVSRLESAVRMGRRFDADLDQISVENMENLLLKHCKNGADQLRSSYRTTVANIRSQFNEDEIFIGFYETLFQEKELLRLSKFLEVDKSKFNVGEVVNRTQKTFKYSRDLIHKLRKSYDDEYKFVVDELGLEPSVWQNSFDKLCVEG